MDSASTLPEFFQAQFAPMYCVGVRLRTLREYKFTLNLWRQLTENPALVDLSIETLATFRQKLTDGTRSPATSNLEGVLKLRNWRKASTAPSLWEQPKEGAVAWKAGRSMPAI